MSGNPRFDHFVAQQGTKNLATGPKIESLLNTHPVSTHARFAINWTKTFWGINDRKPSHWCTDAGKRHVTSNFLAGIIINSINIRHKHKQYIPRNMHTVLLCFALLWLCNRNEFTWSIYPYSSGLLCWHWAIVRLPQCQWIKPDGYGKISQCITTTKHSKAKTVCIFLGIYCIYIYIKQNVHQFHVLSWDYQYHEMALKIRQKWRQDHRGHLLLAGTNT